MAGLTENGLTIKSQDEIISDLAESTVTQFGNSADTTVNSVLGRATRIVSDPISDLYQLLSAVHSQFNPYTAVGVNLDNVVALGHMQRLKASHSTAPLLVYGSTGTEIPSSSYVSSSSTSESWLTKEDVTLDTKNVIQFLIKPLTANAGDEYRINFGGYVYSYTAQNEDTVNSINNNLYNKLATDSKLIVEVGSDSTTKVTLKSFSSPRDLQVTQNVNISKIGKKVRARSEKLGAIYQPKDSIDTITVPVSGWDSVTNPEESTNGRSRETDTELSRRFAQAKSLNAKGTLDAVRSNLISLDSVESVDIYENEDNIENLSGLPPKSFSTIILGGNTQEIAETIWSVKPAGIATHGNTVVKVRDSTNKEQTVKFSRPTFVTIFVEMTIKPLENQLIDSNYQDAISNALVGHISSLSLGEDVSYSRLYTPINSVGGFEVVDLKVGRDKDKLSNSTVVLNYDEKASLVASDVVINKKDS